MSADLFAQCESCLNRELDPLRCRGCRAASHYEGEGDHSEDLACHEFIELFREEEE